MKVAGYLCSSISSKVNKPLELKIQREQIEKYCKEHSFDLIRVYSDQPTDKNSRRPALDRLIKDATRKEFDRVIVLKFDRISYDKNQRLLLQKQLNKFDVELFSIAEPSGLNETLTEKQQAKINAVLRKVKDIPSLPEVVTKVMELVSNPSSSASELGRVISHDPGLTTKVLRLVNSAYYGFPKQISSIQQAIMILGFTTMRGLVLSTSIFKIFAPKDGQIGMTIDYKEFWKHSISTALCARIIAPKAGINEAGDAFSCGILHDIGKIVFDQYDHPDYVEVFRKLPRNYTNDELIAMEEKIIGINHAEIGFKVSEKWNLPSKLSETIRCHHTPMDSLYHSKLVSVIYVANIFANIINSRNVFMSMSMFDPNVLDFLALTEDDLFELLSICKEEVDKGGELDSFFE